MAEGLDVVVQKAERTEPDGRNNHQLHIDIVQSANEQYGNQDGQQNKDSAHRRRAALGELPLKAQIAYLLTYLVTLQHTDNRATKEDGNQQSQHNGYGRTKRYVLEHTRTGQIVSTV